MFLSDTHLPQLLPASAYTDPEWFAREKQFVLIPGWHMVATTDEIRNPGDFITTTILDHPVILHNADGRPQGFINSCAHRLSKLTSATKGNQCRLKCQYHGWEYDAEGATRRIPDAPGFRPLTSGQLGLVPLKTETCGNLIFVQLKRGGPSIAEYLGELHGRISAACSANNVQLCSWSHAVDANWKVVVENTLESYHVSEVHRGTLGNMPAEGSCQHGFGDRWSSFSAPGGVPGFVGDLQRRLLKALGVSVSRTYHHLLVLPTLTLSILDDLVIVWTVEPIEAQQTRLTLRAFSVQSPTRSHLGDAILRYSSRSHLSFWAQVWKEDVSLYPSIQQGMNAPLLPGPGLLSRREERIHHFQKWVLRGLEGRAMAGRRHEEMAHD